MKNCVSCPLIWYKATLFFRNFCVENLSKALYQDLEDDFGYMTHHRYRSEVFTLHLASLEVTKMDFESGLGNFPLHMQHSLAYDVDQC